mgnify:CR=1 FL=1
MIVPTIGRIVWYWPSLADPHLASFGAQPMAAVICYVWSDTCVNLAIFDRNGNSVKDPPTSILLVQEGAERPSGGHFCEWMPYQVKKPTGSESRRWRFAT